MLPPVVHFDNRESTLILMPYNTVFIVKAVVRTVVICTGEKTCHFVLVKIYHAGIAVVVLVIDIVGTAFAVR